MSNKTMYYQRRQEARIVIKKALPNLRKLKTEQNQAEFNSLLLQAVPEIKNYINRRIKMAIEKGHFPKNKYATNDFIDQLFVETYDHIEEFDNEDEFSIWLYQMTNELLDDAFTKEEFDDYQDHLKKESFYNEYIIKQIDNPDARRIKFKDERKLTVGISKKDLLSTKVKQKSAFYNCFAITVRIYTNVFKEMHIKVFNTGKMEIPGIVEKSLLGIVKKELLCHLRKYMGDDLEFVNTDVDHNVLINSNFNCGFYVNREKLHHIMKSNKYGLETSYDPCSYPGVKCKYYYNIDKPNEDQTGRISKSDNNMTTNDIILSNKYLEISFMIFRTGSCLIVGNCNEEVLRFVYKYIVNLLFQEYHNICIKNKEKFVKIKNDKLKKRKFVVDYDYYNDIILKFK